MAEVQAMGIHTHDGEAGMGSQDGCRGRPVEWQEEVFGALAIKREPAERKGVLPLQLSPLQHKVLFMDTI
jgi:hypothetical protein